MVGRTSTTAYKTKMTLLKVATQFFLFEPMQSYKIEDL